MHAWLGVTASILLFVAPPERVTVRVRDGRVDVQARSAPVSDVLDRLAEKTGMTVQYEAGRPQTLVTLQMERRTPLETVRGVLEGLGMNYALTTDSSGSRVTTLIISGNTAVSASPAAKATTTRDDAPMGASRADEMPGEAAPAGELVPPRRDLMVLPEPMTPEPPRERPDGPETSSERATNPGPAVQRPLLPSHPSNPAPPPDPTAPTIQQPLLPYYPSNPAPPPDGL